MKHEVTPHSTLNLTPKFSMSVTRRLFATLLVIAMSAVTAGCGSADSGMPKLSKSSEVKQSDKLWQAINALYESCYNQPEVMVATLSAFPSLAEECGFTSSDPLEMDEELNSPEGGEIQQRSRKILADFLEDPSTEYGFAKWTGKADMLGMDMKDPQGGLTPQNMILLWTTLDAKDANVLILSHQASDNSREVGYFYIEGGFQRFIPREGGFM